MTKLWLQSKKNLCKIISLLCILSLVLAFAPMPVLADDMDETIEEDNDEYTEEDEEYTEEDEEAEAEEEDVEILKTIKVKLSKGDSYLVTTISLPDADDEYFGDYADDEEYTDDYEDAEDTEEDEDEDVTEDYEDDEDTDEDWEEEEEPYLVFSSSNSKIATVDAKGLIKAKKPGKVTITAENNFQIQQFVITVKKEVKAITPKVNEKTLKKGKTFKIKYKLTKGTYSKVTFKSSNKKVARVSSTGKVTAKKKGVAKITLTTYNKKKASVKIIVQ